LWFWAKICIEIYFFSKIYIIFNIFKLWWKHFSQKPEFVCIKCVFEIILFSVILAQLRSPQRAFLLFSRTSVRCDQCLGYSICVHTLGNLLKTHCVHGIINLGSNLPLRNTIVPLESWKGQVASMFLKS